MRMRGARRKSSLAAGADIRTTGVVQLDASRPEKRPRCDDWSFAENSNPPRDGDTAPEEASRLLGTDHHASDKLEREKSRVEDGDESTGNQVCQEEAPALVEEASEPKSLRQFSRTRQPKARNVAEASAQQVLDNVKMCEPSDASSTSLENNQKAETKSRYSLRHSYVDIYQIPEELRYFDDDDDDIPEKKPRSRKRSRKQDSSKTPLNKDKLEMIEQCLNFLEQIGLFRDKVFVDEGSVVAVHPGAVGDGNITENCKVCGRPEDANATLVCDTCEETYHLSCCYPRIRTIPRDDRWLCSFCRRKRKKKTAELKIFPTGHFEEKLPTAWKIDKTKVRGWDLERMERTQVRIGDEFQVQVPEWSGKVPYENLGADYPGFETPRSLADKEREKQLAELKVASNIWPMGWVPAKNLPENERENWLQCQNIIYEVGDHLLNGEVATKDIICGKWRRAPLHIVADDAWECSCAVTWDPRHADCAVPQEIPTEDIRMRPKARMQSPAEELKFSGRRCRGNQGAIDFHSVI